MLRCLLLLLAVCPLPVLAQGPDSLWERLPLKFEWQVHALSADTSRGDLYITNFLGKVNGLEGSIVKWDGVQATFLQPPFDDGMQVITHKGKLIAIGDRFSATTPYMLCNFDGSAWATIDSFGIGKVPVALCILDTSLVVTGFFDTIAGHPIRLSALWNGGSAWSDLFRIDTCLPGWPFIQSVLRYKGQVYAAGTIYGPRSITHIAQFDGDNWKDVGGGIRGNGLGGVSCMLVWKNELYVAGEFFEKDGSPGNCIAKWDGQRWHRLGSGITQGGMEAAVYDMAVYHDDLYVVGVFSEAGGVSVNNIAKWDGNRWCSINTHFDQGTPSQIEVAKGELYLSGGFWTLNGDSVFNIARWTGGDYVDECGPVEPTTVETKFALRQGPLLYPNPAGDILHASRSDLQSLAIYDAAGRLLRTVNGSELQSGIYVAELPSGFYLAKARLRDGTALSANFVKR